MRSKIWQVILLAVALSLVGLSGQAKDLVQAGFRTQFQVIDADGSGYITQREFTAYYTARFDRTDSDKDAVITLDEVTVREKEIYKAMDADGSGFVTRDEFLTYKVGRPVQISDELKKKIIAGIEAGDQMAFAVIDVNGDGQITIAEFAAFSDVEFEIFDADQDGRLTPGEYDLALKRQFKGLDSDGSGTVFREQYNNYWSVPLIKF